jgi:pSer/pThr/pTyr-binding forkhead associated (FHA) protein
MDMGSTNGTYVNGRRLVPNQTYILRDGDEIRFSRLTAHIRIRGLV